MAVDHFRRPHVEVPLDENDAGVAGSPEEAAARNGDLRRLSRLLAGLPAREREILSLKFGAEATNRAIAKVTGLSESNVGTILYRTIAGLRASWDDKGGRA